MLKVDAYPKTNKKSNLLFKNILWNSIGSFVYLALQWGMTIAVTRVLGIGANGIFSLSMSASNVLSCIALYGMRNFQVSDIREDYNDNDYIVSRLFTCLLSIGICLVFVLTSSYVYIQKTAIFLYVLFKTTEALADVYHGILQKEWKMHIIGISLMVRGILSFIIFTLTIFLTRDLLAGLCTLFLSSLTAVLLSEVLQVKKLGRDKQKASMQKIRKLLLECAPLPIYTGIFTAIAYISRHSIEKNLGSEMLGIYAAVSMPTIIVQTFATYIFNPLITSFAECITRKEKKRFVALFLKCSFTIGLLAIASLVVCKIFGAWGLKLLYGEDIARYSGLLNGMVWCTILTSWVWYFSALLTVVRAFNILIFTNILAIITTALCSDYFVSKFGLNGASMAYILPLLVEIILLSYFFVKKAKILFRSEEPY